MATPNNGTKVVSVDSAPASPDASANVAPRPEAIDDVKKSSGFDPTLSGKKVRVMFYEQEGDMGKQPVFGALNGVSYQIPRGVPVVIPVELLEVFNNAKIRALETLQGGGVRERDMLRFSVSVEGLVN